MPRPPVRRRRPRRRRPATAGEEADGSSSGAALPAAPPSVPRAGNGTISVVQVPGPASTATGRVVRYTVEIEGGLGVDAAKVAGTVRGVLLDRRGWQRRDHVRFVNVSPAQAARGAKVDIRITLASPALTDRLCLPLRTMSQVSCWNGTRSVLNLRRWMTGDDSYGHDVSRYRVYQVNHEVGHGLGHGHRSCPGAGTSRAGHGPADPHAAGLPRVALPPRGLSRLQERSPAARRICTWGAATCPAARAPSAQVQRSSRRGSVRPHAARGALCASAQRQQHRMARVEQGQWVPVGVA